jgi:hypothetical protein
MIEIKDALLEQIAKLKDDKNIWLIHNYLIVRRDKVNKKYDYRYSQLIREGYLVEDDLIGLNHEKINIIKSLA